MNKKVLSILLSLQLIVMPMALAESSNQDAAAEQFRENPEAKASGNMSEQLLMMATSAIGSTYMFACIGAGLGGIYPSMVIFAGGSIIYVASEILGGKAQSDAHKKKAEDLKMLQSKMKEGGGGDVQRLALEQALKEEKDTLEYINKKKTWLMAVMAAYYASAAAAVLENVSTGFVANFAILNCAPSIQASLPVAAALGLAFGFMAGSASGGGTMSKIGGMIVPVIFTAGLTLVPQSAMPATRIVMASVSALLATKVVSQLDEKAKIVKENISMMERVLGSFDEQTQSSPGQNGLAIETPDNERTNSAAAAQTGSANRNGNAAISAIPETESNPEIAKTCASKSDTSLKFSADCSNPVKMIQPRFDPQFNVPTLNAAATAVTDLNNALTSGGGAKADVAAANLASMAVKLRGVRDNLVKQMNEKLVAKGKAPMDLEAETKAAIAKINRDLVNGKDSAGLPLMASIEALTPSQLTPAPTIEEKVSLVPEVIQASVPTGASMAMGEGNTSAPEAMTVAEVAPEPIPKLEDYETLESDVSNRKTDSLFDMVSNRYKKNYGHFFKKRDLQESTP